MFQGLLGRSWILVAASLLCCGAALAEDDKGATVSSNGGAAVKLTPTIFRVQVQVLGQGKTVAAALEKLKGRRESAVEKIKSLGANADSIVVGKPSVINARPTPPALYPAPQMGPPVVPAPEAPMAPPTPGAPSPFSAAERNAPDPPETAPETPPSAPPPAAELPSVPMPSPASSPPDPFYGPQPPATTVAPGWIPNAAPGGSKEGVVVSATISADWPLEADGPEALLLKAEKLKKRILDADPSGRKAAAEKAAEEDDTAPAPAQPYQIAPAPAYGVNTGNYPDFGLQFLYVAKVSPKQRQAAMADAFANAKSQAAELATAAGMQCGPLLDLGGSGGVGVTSVAYLQGCASPLGDPSEESSPDLGASFFFRVTVTAKFRLLEK
ncbi:MAG: hypothetical protein ACLQLG_00580 [Thermoguttaceae bacterium]